MAGSLRSFWTPRFIFGLAVIALGVVLFLDNLNIVEAEQILRWWSVILIAVGLGKLIAPASPSARATSWIWIVVGVAILAVNLGWLHFAIRDLWPLALILLGSWIVLRGVSFRSSLGPRARRRPDARFSGLGVVNDAPRSSGDASSTVESFVMWAGIERKNNSREFKGGEISAVMGGYELDLRDASIADGAAVLELFALWGGIDVIVPGDWTVENRVSAILGGVEDSRKSIGSDPGKVLILKGAAVMGGIEITN
jgi:hypothetical protein